MLYFPEYEIQRLKVQDMDKRLARAQVRRVALAALPVATPWWQKLPFWRERNRPQGTVQAVTTTPRCEFP